MSRRIKTLHNAERASNIQHCIVVTHITMRVKYTRQCEGTCQIMEPANSTPVKAEFKNAQFTLQELLPIYVIL